MLALGDHAFKIGSGATPRGGKKAYLNDGPFSLIRSQNVYNHGFEFTGLALIDEDQADKLKNVEVLEGDVLVNITGDSVARVCQVHPSALPARVNQHVAILRPDPESIDPAFLRYWLITPESQAHLLALASAGATRNALTKNMLEGLKLPDWAISLQRNIGRYFCALDDKIDLNRRMNETLEAMAQAIFRDWFVDFGPTRRKVEGASGAQAVLGGLIAPPEKAVRIAALFPDTLGDDGLPVGWEGRSVNDDFDVVMGQSPPGSTYNEAKGGLPFFQGRRDFQFRFPEKRVYCNAPTRLAEEDWTLVSVRAPVGDINRAWEKCCIGRGVGALMHKQGLSSLTYYAGLHLKDELATYDKDGTVFGSINQKQLRGLKLNATNSDVAMAFNELVVPIDDLIRSRTAENRTLSATRDLLLPKLMSGELRLRDAETAL